MEPFEQPDLGPYMVDPPGADGIRFAGVSAARYRARWSCRALSRVELASRALTSVYLPRTRRPSAAPSHPRALPRFVGSMGLSCFHDGCLTIHALYAAGFIRAAVPSSLRLPWRSPSAPRLGSLLAPRGVLIDDAAGFT